MHYQIHSCRWRVSESGHYLLVLHCRKKWNGPEPESATIQTQRHQRIPPPTPDHQRSPQIAVSGISDTGSVSSGAGAADFVGDNVPFRPPQSNSALICRFRCWSRVNAEQKRVNNSAWVFMVLRQSIL